MILVELHDRSNVLVKQLPGAKNASYHAMLNQDGSGLFRIQRSDDDAVRLNILTGGIDGYIVHLLRRSPLDAAGAPFVDRFTFVVEAIDQSTDEQEEKNAWITVAGRGSLSLLEDRMVFPPNYDGVSQPTMTSQWQTYVAAGAGTIMATELDRSNPRFAVALTHSNSPGATGPATVKLRFDNMRLLHDYLVANAPMDAQMVGVDYQTFNVLGSDRSAQVVIALSQRDSLRQFKLQRDSRPVKNYVVAGGTGEGINQILRSSSDAPSIAAFRRREGYLAMSQDDTAVQLDADAAGAVKQLKVADVRITTLFMDSLLTQLYRDFGMGDSITLQVALLNYLAKLRVVGIQVADLDSENEEIHLDLNSMQQEYLLSLAKATALAANGLNIISRMPQGAPFNDSQGYPDNCGPTFPFHFDLFVPSNVLKLNYGKLSFFLRAYRADVSAVNNAAITSGASSASSSATSSDHAHFLGISWATATGSALLINGVTGGLNNSAESTHNDHLTANENALHSHLIPHTHSVTSNVSLIYGLFEGAVATGVTVKVNGVDRTSALGGGSGFNANQTELEIGQWLNIGQWNTIDLTPTGLGRIGGHLRVTGYIQST